VGEGGWGVGGRTRLRRRRWAPAAVFCLWAALSGAGSPVAAQPRAETKAGPFGALLEHVRAGGDLVLIYTGSEPAGAPTNPGNRIKAIPGSDLELQLRTRLDYDDRARGLHLAVSPFLTYDRFTVDRAGTPDRNADDLDLVVNGYLAQIRDAIPRTTLTVARQDVEWAPGFFDAPSNPFGVHNSADNPLREDPGTDLAWLSVSPTDRLALTYYNSYSEGAREPSALQPFRRAQLGVATYVAQDFTVSALGGVQEESEGFVGSYGQWTVNDAVLLYYDGVVRRGSDGRYPVADSTLPTGGRYAATKSGSGRLFPELLVGAAYTLATGYTLYGEYLYYAPGYGDADLERSRRINRAAADLFATPLEDLGAQTLGQAALPNLRHVGRHFMNLQVTKTFGPLRLVVQNALALQDWTGRLFMSVQYAFQRYAVALTGIGFYGRAGGVFRQDLDGRFAIGIARHF
ncbi:MAG: hypothetical protein ACREMB_24625, partial [Candidatus Rokuibacteriota bacterium]